jgi:hypothetical protein
MKISSPYGTSGSVKVPPETINAEMSQAGSKATARYPHKPISNQPGGGGSTGNGSFKRAMTPGTTPTGS